MADYLLKTEPSEYSFAGLQKDGATVWDGVSNPVALRNLRDDSGGSDGALFITGMVDDQAIIGLHSAEIAEGHGIGDAVPRAHKSKSKPANFSPSQYR